MKTRSQCFFANMAIIIITPLVWPLVTQGGEVKASSLNSGARHQARPPLEKRQPAVLPPFTLWYNGDWSGTETGQAPNYVALDCYEGGYGRTYDDFIVSSPNGWKVTGLFTNVFVDYAASDCFILADGMWEIRQGVYYGTPGTLIASGFMDGASASLTGNWYGSFSEYQVLVTGLDISLPAGTYWLNVTPVGEFGAVYYGNGGISATVGANCVGSPCGNDHNSFLVDSSGDYWAALNSDYSMGVTGYSCPGNCEIYVSSAKSIKIMLSGLELDVPLTLTGESAVEDRSGGTGGNYTVAMTFSQSIISVAHASVSCGRVASTSINGSVLTVNLTGVGNTCNASDITLAVNDVKDDAGDNLGSVCVTMGMLLGDVDGNRVVDSNDSAIVRSQLGQSTNSTNLRSDVNNDGTISSADLQIISRHLGTRLP